MRYNNYIKIKEKLKDPNLVLYQVQVKAVNEIK